MAVELTKDPDKAEEAWPDVTYHGKPIEKGLWDKMQQVVEQLSPFPNNQECYLGYWPKGDLFILGYETWLSTKDFYSYTAPVKVCKGKPIVKGIDPCAFSCYADEDGSYMRAHKRFPGLVDLTDLAGSAKIKVKKLKAADGAAPPPGMSLPGEDGSSPQHYPGRQRRRKKNPKWDRMGEGTTPPDDTEVAKAQRQLENKRAMMDKQAIAAELVKIAEQLLEGARAKDEHPDDDKLRAKWKTLSPAAQESLRKKVNTKLSLLEQKMLPVVNKAWETVGRDGRKYGPALRKFKRQFQRETARINESLFYTDSEEFWQNLDNGMFD